MRNDLSPGRTGDHRILEQGDALEIIYILYLHCTDQESKDHKRVSVQLNSYLMLSDSYLMLVPLE